MWKRFTVKRLCYSGVASVASTNLETLITADELQARVRALAREIRRDHPDGVHLIGVLKGSFIFLADLARSIAEDSDGTGVTMDFIAASSYGSSANSSGQVQLLKDLGAPIQGRDVVIVEDIIDTGLTLTYLHQVLRARQPRTLRTACLLSKPSRRKVDVDVEYVGFTIEDRFVVGYGLDYAEAYRALPFIGVVKS
jgi:hypoxanthine phosphoribosyltransferase